MGQNLLFLSDLCGGESKGSGMDSSVGYWGAAGSVLSLSGLVGRGFYFFFLEKQPNIIKL